MDESTLLNEIEQILGFGSLSSKSRTDSQSQNELTSSHPDPVAKGHKLGKSRSEEAPLVPGRDSSKGEHAFPLCVFTNDVAAQCLAAVCMAWSPARESRRWAYYFALGTMATL